MLELKTGLNAPENFLEQVFEIDKQTYSPELCGVIENLYKRYNRCRDSFLLVYDGELLVGYICFLPLSEKLFKEMNDPENLKMRDDDIAPCEMEDWRKERHNNLFVLSLVVIPEYRKGETIKLLGNGFLDFLREKENNGYCIGSIAGSAVSSGGANFLKRFYAEHVKDVDGGYKYYFVGREKIKELLKNGLLLKNL